MSVAIIIPAYNPTSVLLDLVEALQISNDVDIILVNDGSLSNDIFKKILASSKTHLLTHTTNLGKGKALKTGMSYALVNLKNVEKFVTADADGQHAVEDILKLVASPLIQHELILGSRNFSSPKVPWRSRFGNRLMSFLFFIQTGIRLTDTQTGLRVFSPSLAKEFVNLPNNGYEFEMDMLIFCKKQRLQLSTLNIQTLYLDNNKSSHFNPIFDSLRITFTLFRFTISSVITAIIDTFFFYLAFFVTQNLLTSLISGRIVAGCFNFYINHLAVYKQKKMTLNAALKYLLLVLALVILSYYSIEYIHEQTMLSVLMAKILIETLIFTLSFSIQTLFVFKSKDS